MNENSNINNNVTDTERIDNKKWNGIDFTGPCAVFRRQYF